MKELSVGVEYLEAVGNLKMVMDKLQEDGYNFVCARMINDQDVNNSSKGGELLSTDNFWSDSILSSTEWTSGIMGVVQNLEDLEDPKTKVMHGAKKVTNQLVDYYHHLGISTIMFELNGPSCNLADILSTRLNQHVSQFVKFWAKVPVGSLDNELEENWESCPSWYWYNQFRKVFGNSRQLKAILRIGGDLPGSNTEIDRWNGENVGAICLPQGIFQTNAKGYPVLSRRHQEVIKKFFRHGVPFILEVKGSPEEPTTLCYYRQYIMNLYQKYQDDCSNHTDPYFASSSGWENHLQSPLQPLMDNLGSQTYMTFEQDSTKYNLYFTAIRDALLWRLDLEAEKLKLTEDQKKDFTLIVMVAGAGRGPLVTEALRASSITQIKVKVYALEKNPNAQVRLLRLNKNEWNSQVTVVSADMRYWNAPEKADIIVSELLGSFGDNELSPECLDGAQRLLKDSGVMIPQKYTSFIGPIMSHVLFTDIIWFNATDASINLETPLVVYMTKKFDIAKPKELFTYIHPNPELLRSWHTNERYCKVEFDIYEDCECHGFAGYFDSVLFENDQTGKQVTMSILPDTYSEGLFSWFPLYIPLKAGVSLKKGDKLIVAFWRKISATKVWYEWTILSPATLTMHNSKGESFSIGLDPE